MLNVEENGDNQLVIPDYHMNCNERCNKDRDLGPYLGKVQTKVDFMRKISETDVKLRGSTAGLAAILEKDESSQ